jgi:predicted RNase H-like HicB family nuclease
MITRGDNHHNPMKFLADYTIVIRPDDNGTSIAYVPALRGCHALASTPEVARLELENVFDMFVEEFLEAGHSLPQDVELTIAHTC